MVAMAFLGCCCSTVTVIVVHCKVVARVFRMVAKALPVWFLGCSRW